MSVNMSSNQPVKLIYRKLSSHFKDVAKLLEDLSEVAKVPTHKEQLVFAQNVNEFIEKRFVDDDPLDLDLENLSPSQDLNKLGDPK